ALVIGFAADTEDVVANGEAKRKAKGCDWILANDVSPGSGVLGGNDNTVHLIRPDGTEDWPAMAKPAVAARLAEDPDDRDGWLLLGRSYAQIEQFGAAAEAYRRARDRGFDDAEVQSALGEMLAAQAGGTIGPEARNAFAAALAQDPQNPRARYYAGLVLAQDGRAQDAIDIWLGLLRQSTAEAPWRSAVAQQIQEAAASLGIPAPELPVAPDPVAPDPLGGGTAQGGAQPGPDAADVEAAGQMSAEDRAAFIRSMVARLAERLEAEPGDFQGWLRLARAYGVLGEASQARDALSRAEAAIRERPEGAPERAQLEAARKAGP
ncbi:MAG: tetratricopeptide repeat protein, partial [Proteobacteria bacterium]|nr:tetratricopeptide repeat protein [Pseudomonadota bacterium]